MYCKQCGSELGEGAKFCSGCGSTVMVQDQAAVINKPVKKPLTAKMKNALIIGGIGLVVVIVAMVTVLLIPSAASSAVSTVVYSKSDEIDAANLNSLEPFEVSESEIDGYSMNLDYFISMSKDGRYLYYPEINNDDSTTTIYRRDLNLSEKDKNAVVKIDSGIDYYFNVLPDNRTVYIKASNKGLYINDAGKKEKIDSEVSGYYLDKDKLVYATNDNDIYFVDLNKLEKEKLATEAELLSFDEEMTTFYFQKDGNLYQQVVGGDKEKIASDVSTFVTLTDDGTLYYTKDDKSTIKLGDYLNDDMAEADAAIAEPNISDYESYELVTTIWGDQQYETVTNYDAYYVACDQYEQKTKRDEIREQAGTMTTDINTATLYSYKKGEETKITDNFRQMITGWKSGVVVYDKYETKMPEKKNISELNYADELNYIFDSVKTNAKPVYATNGQKEMEITNNDSYSFLARENLLYYIDDYDFENTTGTLKRITINNGELGAAEVVDEDVSLFAWDEITDTLLYFKDIDDAHGDLYMNGNKIDSDVFTSQMYITQDGKTLYYYSDYNDEKGTGTIKRYNGANSEDIAYDAGTMKLLAAKLVYLADYSSSKQRGDLCIYVGGESKIIDDDVTTIYDTWISEDKPHINFVWQNHDYDGEEAYAESTDEWAEPAEPAVAAAEESAG